MRSFKVNSITTAVTKTAAKTIGFKQTPDGLGTENFGQIKQPTDYGGLEKRSFRQAGIDSST